MEIVLSHSIFSQLSSVLFARINVVLRASTSGRRRSN